MSTFNEDDLPPMYPAAVAETDQLGAYWDAHAERLGKFYRRLRVRGVPRWLAAALTLMEQDGYHLRPPPDS